MNIRAVLVACLAAVVIVSIECRHAFAWDPYGNCTALAGGDQLCSATNSGSALFLGNPRVFTVQRLYSTQTGTLTNVGNTPYWVIIEQGLAKKDPVSVPPGRTVEVSPIDNNAFSWGEFAVVIVPSEGAPNLTADAKARIHVNAVPTRGPISCGQQCTEQANSCRTGCGILHAPAGCLVGCDNLFFVCYYGCPADQRDIRRRLRRR